MSKYGVEERFPVSGFSWDNLTQQPPGTTEIPRRGGQFLWEQFHELSKLGVDTTMLKTTIGERDERGRAADQ